MKKARVAALLLTLPFVLSALASCNTGGGEGNSSLPAASGTGSSVEITGADTSGIPEIPTDGRNDPVQEVPSVEGSTRIPAEELLTLIREGRLEKDGDYTVSDGVYLVFDGNDRSKTYDLNGATIRVGARSGEAGVQLNKVRAMTLKNGRIVTYGGVAVSLTGSVNCTLSDLHISGNGEGGLSVAGRANTVDHCTVIPLQGGTLTEGIVSLGENIAVTNCNLQELTKGIVDRSENGTVIENNLLTDCATGISAECPDSVIWYNTVTGGTCGISAQFERAELSAGMGKGYNILAAQNIVTGAECSLRFAGVSNSVVLLNRLENATVTGCINAYVNENQVSGTLTLNACNYIIANDNVYATLVQSENTNVNGDTLTDLSCRLTSGANEELLPHINADQFVGMTRKQTVRATDGADLSEYLKAQIKTDRILIIPPGAYDASPISISNVRNCTVYAYGVLNEASYIKSESAFTFHHCEQVTVKGLFIGVAIYSHTQGTVVAASSVSKSFSFIADPGYQADYSNGYNFGNAAGYYFKNGNLYPECDFTYATKSYDADSGKNTVKGATLNFANLDVGDRVAFRSGFGGGGIHCDGCSEMLFEDLTIYNCSGFALSDTNSDVAPTLHRYAVTAGPAPVLDESKDYSAFADLLWKDSYGRLRSAEPMNTSCDATHCTNARVGIQLISCLLERMNDDGGNINAYYGLASGFDAATNTLTYTTCDVNSYQLLPSDFRIGDTVMLYTMSGRLVGRTTVKTATKDLGSKQYAIGLESGITLPTNEQVVVQNLSASGGGFLIDNVMVRDAGANGFRLKSSGGTVKNCTFERVSKSGVVCNLEYWLWPEVGYTLDLKIQNNVFHQTGNTSRGADPASDSTWCSPISVRFSVAYQESNWNNNYSPNPEVCLHENIEISGNVITERFCPYAIGISGVQKLYIFDNVIGARYGQTDASDTQAPIALFGGRDIVIARNQIPSGAAALVDFRGGDGSYTNVSFAETALPGAYAHKKSGYGDVIGTLDKDF